MDQGRVEITQMYTTWLAEKFASDLLAFELPYLFSDHDHATRVLEGPVGEKLLSKIREGSNNKFRALSYTYSGGFRCTIVNEQIKNLEDLVGQTVRCNGNPVAKAVWRSMVESEPYICEIEETRDRFQENHFVAADTVFSRVYPLQLNDYTQTVVDTKHTLFLTTMLVSEKFWSMISDETRAIIKQAAIEAGRAERAETILDGQEAREQLEKEGVKVVDLTEEDRQRLVEKSSKVYDEFRDFFENGLVDQIKHS
jgi:TRAP-type C4-dicarboxylate transport system substrate-binding protein